MAQWEADNALLVAINLAQHQPAAHQPYPENVALADKFAAVDAALGDMFSRVD